MESWAFKVVEEAEVEKTILTMEKVWAFRLNGEAYNFFAHHGCIQQQLKPYSSKLDENPNVLVELAKQVCNSCKRIRGDDKI